MAAPPAPVQQFKFAPGSNAFDVMAYDDAVRAHGVRFVHHRAMPDPVGLVDEYDVRRPGEDHAMSSNGMIYTEAGMVYCLLTGNSKSLRAQTGGWLDASTAQITSERFYCSCRAPICQCKARERVYLMPSDRLVLSDRNILAPIVDKARAHETGVDRLKFPAVRVIDLVDSQGVRYKQGQDFEVSDGMIAWGTNRPPDGAVYAVRYLIRPSWYVQRLMHELRPVQQVLDATRETEPAQQSALVQREYVHMGSEKRDPLSPNPDSSRQAPGPADGGFGPR